MGDGPIGAAVVAPAEETTWRLQNTWDGVLDASVYAEWVMEARIRLADAARSFDWGVVFSVLDEHVQFVNAARPGGQSWFAPLHQAAYGGADPGVVEGLVERGGWRLLKTARGELPVDIARRLGHHRLVPLLEPDPVRDAPDEVLSAIQRRFHDVIHDRAGDLLREAPMRLPEIATALELPEADVIWFPIPGMYGGFNYRLTGDGESIRLVTESWCRVVGGSGQRHEIMASRTVLLEEGFV